jgi:hypothetical protein
VPDFGGERSASPVDFDEWNSSRKLNWLNALFHSWGGFIHDSAVKHNVPERLLQVIIVTEMMDMR